MYIPFSTTSTLLSAHSGFFNRVPIIGLSEGAMGFILRSQGSRTDMDVSTSK